MHTIFLCRVSSISEGGVSWLSVFSHNKEGTRQGMERDMRRYSREAEEAMAGGLGKVRLFRVSKKKCEKLWSNN